jgi:hypothetical protein
MNKHWYYLEQEMARRMEIYNRELAEARLEQQFIQQRIKAITKAFRHFTLRGLETMTTLIHKGLSTSNRRSQAKHSTARELHRAKPQED